MKAWLHSGRATPAVFLILFLVSVACVVVSAVAFSASTTLRQAGELRHIRIGAAAASRYLSEPEYGAIRGSEFSQVRAENEMKFGLIPPRPDTDPNPYDFAGGDAVVAFAQSHNLLVRGHTLVWHNAMAADFQKAWGSGAVGCEWSEEPAYFAVRYALAN